MRVLLSGESLMEVVIEPYYQRRATEFIDILFDKGYFAENIKREEMREVEEFLAYCFQSQVGMAVKCVEMLKRSKERKTDG